MSNSRSDKSANSQNSRVNQPQGKEEEAPLELVDSDHGTSTPPEKSPKSASESSKSSSTAQKSASKQGTADSATSSGSGSSGSDSSKSTSGFETMLGKVVVDRGLVAPEELESATALSRESSQTDTPRMLSDVLIENQYVTSRQLKRLRAEFEAEKSTQKIPGYKMYRKLGSGAMATVYLGKQVSLDRNVAIKVLPKKFSTNEKFIERFYKEGRAAAKLNDPNIVGAYDVGQAGEHHYFVMEYVDGDTVYDRIVKQKRFSEKEAINVIRQVASALKHAHDKGFIHRDIKPKNIMIASSNTVKLADLGLARAVSDKQAAEAEAGRAYGTPYYISPEQIRGERTIGPAADLYGLGATFYHMVTGRVPYKGKNPSEVMHKHLKAELVPPDHVNPKLSNGCAQVIEKMMAQSAEDRYQNAEDLLYDLDLVSKGESPHFAASDLDLSGMVEQIQETTTDQPATPAAPALTSKPSLTSNPTFMVVLILLILSGLGNLVALVAFLT